MPTSSLPQSPVPQPRQPWIAASPALDTRLLAAAENVLRSWALLEARQTVFQPQTRASDFLHGVATLLGPRPGLLCVSAPARLGTMLATASSAEASSGGAPDALLRFAALLRDALLQAETEPAQRGLLQPSPHWSLAADLPSQAPQGYLSLLLNGYPLELRLWLD
jgi:hypothetical protein